MIYDRVMFTGDVFSCQKQLNTLLKRNNAGESSTVEEIQKMLSKFTSRSFIPVEYSEKLLTGVGNLMERCSDEDVLGNFAANAGFVGMVTTIISDYAKKISPPSPVKPISQTSFSSHYCYELSLFMLLGLLDKTRILKIFVRSTAPTEIERLLQSICSVIPMDYLHLTQEVGLEVVCRLGHYLLQQHPDTFKTAMASAAPELREAVSRAEQIPVLLRDMRPLLNKINESNPNVFSLETSTFSISTTWRKVDVQREVHGRGWLDLCKDAICYNLLEEEVLIRFTYQSIKKVHFDEQGNCVQILLYECPKKLRELLRKEETPPPGQCPVLLFHLSGGAQALATAQSVMEMRMIEHETVRLEGTKYSVVSSKDQSPDAVDKAKARLQQTDTTKGPHFVSPKSSSTAQQAAKGGTAMTTRKKAREQGSPSSISSPDMEVPSEDTPAQIGHAVGEEPHEDTLLAFGKPAPYLSATKATAGTATHTTAAAGTAAGRKRGGVKAQGGDALSRLPDAKKAAAARPIRRSPRTSGSATKAGRKPATTPTPRRKGEQETRRAGTAEVAGKDNIQPVQPEQMDVGADFGDGGGFDDFPQQDFPQQDFPAPEIEMIVEPARKARALQSLTDSALNAARGAGRTPTTVRGLAAAAVSSTLTTPQTAGVGGGDSTVGQGKSRMRKSVAEASGAPSAVAEDKENALPTWMQGASPAPSQAGTSSSGKRKFGRPIPLQPVPITGVDWLAMDDLLEEDDKMRALQKRREEALENRSKQQQQSTGKRKTNGKPPLPLAAKAAGEAPPGQTKNRRASGAPPAAAGGGELLLKKTSTKARMHTPIASVAARSGPPSGEDDSMQYSAGAQQDHLPEDNLAQDFGNGGGGYEGYEGYDARFMDAAPPSPAIDQKPQYHKPAPQPAGIDVVAEDFSWRQQTIAGRDKPVAGTKSAFAVFAAKLQAGRAELTHSVTAQQVTTTTTAVPSAAAQAPLATAAEEPMDEEAPAPSAFKMGSFSLPRLYSQVSRSHTSRASSVHDAVSEIEPMETTHKPGPVALDVEDPFSGASKARMKEGRRPVKPVAVRGRAAGRKRRALEAELSDSEEEAGSGVDASEEISGSSLEEENEVVAALLREIVIMQKERAKRKRARMLSNVGNAAKAQVVGFLDQWRTFAENSCGEVQRGVNAQLEHVCAQADTLCDALGRDVQVFAQHDQDMERDLVVLERDVAALKTELGGAVTQCRTEETQVRNELAALKNRALDTATKTLSMHKGARQHNSKQYGLELAQALKAV